MTTATLIRRLFALPRRARPPRPAIPAAIVRQATPAAGEIALFTGPSGGGKSRLLEAVRAAQTADPTLAWIEPADIPLTSGGENVCVIERMCREIGLRNDAPAPIELALELLSRVGLAEAWTYLRTPAELSDGQRWRLVLALAVARAMYAGARDRSTVIAMIAMDEFAALLDRITARIVARALRRLIDAQHTAVGVSREVVNAAASGGAQAPSVGPRISAIVATSHDDLRIALDPDVIVTCDFQAFTVQRPCRPTWLR